MNKNKSITQLVKQSIIVFRISYSNWLINSRMLIFPLFCIVFYEVSISHMREYSDMMNTPLNLLEPFILITNCAYIVPLIPVFYLLLVSDFPKMGTGEYFILLRTGKLSWLLGQFIFFIVSAITFLMTLFLFSCSMVIDRSFIANGWSEVTRFIRDRSDFNMIVFNAPASVIEKNLYMHSRPYEAAVRSLLLIFLYLMVISGILLLFNICHKKTIGIICSFVVVILGFVTWGEGTKAMWLFPMANSIYGSHNQGILSEKIYPVANSYIYFCILIILLSAASYWAIRKNSIYHKD